MKYIIDNNKIIVENGEDFNIQQTLECGQVFRYKVTTFGYEVYSLNHKATVYCHKDKTEICCDDAKYFEKYFDFNENYAIIKQRLGEFNLMKDSLNYGSGIRILNQDAFETIISFIISQNNNIPRIQKIIETICKDFGDDCDGYYAFPRLEQIAKANKEYFKSIKCGYRDSYLYNTIQMLNNGFNLEVVKNLTSFEANDYLTQLSGVGPKVADCILLFGFHKTDVFPTDTWIKKVFNDLHPNKNYTAKQISKYFVGQFKDLSGYAQQYLFYYKRERNKKGEMKK